MTDKPENPQAFPHGNPTHGGDTGMSLRDYFAGQALAGLASIRAYDEVPMNVDPDIYYSARAYELADAMLKERSKALEELK